MASRAWSSVIAVDLNHRKKHVFLILTSILWIFRNNTIEKTIRKFVLTVGNAVLASESLVEVHMGEEEGQKNCLQ